MTLYDDLIKILSDKDIDAFLPILGTGRLFSLDKGDLFTLVVDPELNLLKMIILSKNNYESELKKFDEKYFWNIDGFLVFHLYKYTSQDLRESVVDILTDPAVEDFSLLVEYHLMRSLDYDTLINLCASPSFFKKFLQYLLKDFKNDEEWQNYGIPPYSPFYEDLGFHLTESLGQSLLELIREFDLAFVLMLYTLDWFKFLNNGQLKEIIGITKEKIQATDESSRIKARNVIRSIEGKLMAYERGILERPVRKEDDYVIIKGLKYYVHDKALDLSNIGIQDISEIEGLDKLTELQVLDLSDNQIREIKGLDCLKNLHKLHIKRTKLTEIKGLENLTLLSELDLFYNKITEIKGLENLGLLGRLHLGNNKITEIKGLANNKYLEELFLHSNQITEIKGLESLTGLRILNIAYNKITEIKGLDTLRNLYSLLLGDNQIAEIKGLEKLKNLRRLFLQKNQISEVKGLEHIEWLKELDLSSNKIPKNLIEKLGGTEKYGRALKPQNFIDYCRSSQENNMF